MKLPLYQKATMVIPMFALVMNLTLVVSAQVSMEQKPPDASLTLLETTVSDLVNDAREHNISLQSKMRAIEVAHFQAQKLSYLDPPTFAIEAMNTPLSSFPNPFKDRMEMDYSLQQMFMFPGKLHAMKHAELAKVDMASMEKSSLEQEIILQVKQTVYDIYLIDRQLKINAASQKLYSDLVGISRKQYEVGMGKQAEILRLQTQALVVEKNLIALMSKREAMVSMLNGLAGRDLNTAFPSLPEIDPLKIQIDTMRLIDKAMAYRPEIRAMIAQTRMKQGESDVAKLSWLPDFMIKATYQNIAAPKGGTDSMAGRGNPDTWSLMFGFTIPEAPWSFRKASTAEKQAQSSYSGSMSDLEQMKVMIKTSLSKALLEVASSKQQVLITATRIIPLAHQTLDAAFATYRSGGEEFVMVLDAEKMLLMTQDDYHMHVMKYLSALAQLEREVGSTVYSIHKDGLQ